MIHLDWIRQAISKATKPTENEEATSQTLFDTIVTCIEQEKMDEAAVAIETIFAKNIPDFRLIAYYFYAHFYEYGVVSFLEVFPELNTIINDHWDLLRPHHNKEKQIQNSLNWFVLQVINKLKYGEKLHKAGKGDPIWEKSTIHLTSDELNQIIRVTSGFKNFFYAKWPQSPINERIMHLVKVVEDLKNYVEETSQVLESEVNALAIAPRELPEQQNLSFNFNSPEEPLEGISNKIKLFELLIKKNEYIKAALVSKDIDHLIENFDPRVYFPKMFANYYSLIAKNVDAISAEWEKLETPQSKYLDKLYKTDFNLFVDW